MSVLAYHSVAENQETANQKAMNSVDTTTNISTNARIDYILRFSKQLVVVVAPDSSEYTPVTSQFLANLPHSHNAAFIAASNQFHDIQIRSRIIEQLFANILFDPEQSLAVSLINLIKTKPQNISIAIEHGQTLSIQILHELTQLAEIAKKNELTINIVVAGDYLLGHKLSESSILFKNKISIVNGNTGQLVPLKSSLFKQPSPWLSPLNIKIASVVTVIILMTLSFVYFYQQVPENSLVTSSLVEEAFVEADEAITLNVKNNTLDKPLEMKAINADNSDIMHALLLSSGDNVSEIADQVDIFSALTHSAYVEEPFNQKKLSDKTILIQSSPRVINSTVEIADLDAVYFSLENGFVIQFAAFSEPKIKDEFLQLFPNLLYHTYQRMIGDKTFEVFTSKPYSTRVEVEAAKANLSSSVKKLNVWVKSLKTVQTEIADMKNL